MALPRSLVPAALLVATLAACAPRAAQSESATNDTLSFELWGRTWPRGWGGGPPGTLFRDSTVVHGGRYAVRIERSPTSPSEFTTVHGMIPINFTGKSVEIRGWLKTDDVSGLGDPSMPGFAGLWMREDDARMEPVQFDNMVGRRLGGTTPWAEYRVSLRLDKTATSLFFGALLSGTGTLWVDDLELWVDGKPLARTVPPGAQRDREFDAGSGIADTVLTAVQVESIALLGKVWGFVKYHHPKVTGGSVNWDYELFRALPRVLAAKSAPGAQQEISGWLARLGEPAPCSPCAARPESAAVEARVGWIRDSTLLGTDLRARLGQVYANRSTGGQYFASRPAGSAGNLLYENEAAYPPPSVPAGASPPPPDPGFRLIALLRFWNIIEYWYPNRELIPGSWDAVLREFVPRVMGATTWERYQLEMLALVARINDGHANAWSAVDWRPPTGLSRLPVAVRCIEGRYVVSAHSDPVAGPATGLMPGDVLVAIDGLRVDSLATSVAEYYGASNEPARRRDISRGLTNGGDGPCRVTVERAGKRIELTALRAPAKGLSEERYFAHDRPGDTFQMLAPEVAYLKLSSVNQKDARSYIERAAGTQVLVIDIRNYPREFVPFALGQHLVDRPTPFVCFTVADLANPGAFTWTPPETITPSAPRYGGKVVILVDEVSQSQAEYTAMALRAAPGAIVVGSTTGGADGNVSNIALPGRVRAMISGIGVFYADRRPTQQIGVVPDLVVEPTIAGIREGRDEVLEAALERALGHKVTLPRP